MSVKTFLLASLFLLSISFVNAWRLNGINYSHRGGKTFSPDMCKSEAEIEKDFVALKRVTDQVRIYSISECDAGKTVLNVAAKHGMKVWLGMWIGPSGAHFSNELNKLEELIKQNAIDWKIVLGMHVGTQGIFRGDYSEHDVIGYLKQVRETLTKYNLQNAVDLSTSETAGQYFSKDLIDAVDAISVNMIPFFIGQDYATAAKTVITELQNLRNFAGDKKRIVLTETGWPSGGANALASPTAQANFLQHFLCLIEKTDYEYFYFIGLDDEWKFAEFGDYNSVQGHFGLFTVDRKMKPEIAALPETFQCGEERQNGPTTSDSVRKLGISRETTKLSVIWRSMVKFFRNIYDSLMSYFYGK